MMLDIKGVTKIYGGKVVAVSNVSFQVNNGEIVGFVGLNGAGKTTTIKISCGVLIPNAGTVYVDGYDILREKIEASRRVGWLPEIPIFDPNARALSLLKYIAGFHNITGEAAEKRALELLKDVGLAGLENRKLGTFSQGMRKRFALAASMIADPSNYLFDEVLNGLDPAGINFFRNIAQEFKKKGKAILFSSHILSEVENLADRIVIIHKGKIIKVIDASELENIGTKTLKIVIKNIDNRLIDVLKSYGDIRIENQNVVILSNFKGEPAEINLELSKMGYLIESFNYQKTGLEDYFLSLVGEKNVR
jgi:ABC-2 type transport system ATP-binding protein